MRWSPLLILATVALCGCGLPGAPLAPSMHIPKPVQDLRAVRKGNDVFLSWTAPTQCTDGTLIRKPGKLLITRAVGAGKFANIAEVTLPAPLGEDQHVRNSLTDSLANLLQSATQTDVVAYQIVTIGERNRTAGPGNTVQVSALPVLRAPARLELRTVPSGVEISFPSTLAPASGASSQYAYKIFRQLEGSKSDPVVVAQLQSSADTLMAVDSKIEWESTYEYWVTPVTHWQAGSKQGDVEGEDSPKEKILAHDSFPPAAPNGVQAVYGSDPQRPSIDLTWTPNTEQDLAGYNVYRREGAGSFVKVNAALVKTPSFHDAQVKAGSTFIYSVTAVDTRNNESEKSKEASERVPVE